MEQKDRNLAFVNFKNKSRILIATDCAQRGLDFPNVGVVVNYDCPKMVEDYIHRIGRTGRIGSEGKSITFVNQATNKTVLYEISK